MWCRRSWPLFILSVGFVWLNQTGRTDEIEEIDQMHQANEMNQINQMSGYHWCVPDPASDGIYCARLAGKSETG
jgi:hypothetical protein